ncbi:MAG: spore germination protein [Clostridia bacterium]|nr:spore germination protein [Clostridia bacterium]
MTFENIDSAERAVRGRFESCADLSVRRVALRGGCALVCSLGGLADKNYISEKILRPLMDAEDAGQISSIGDILQAAAYEETADAQKVFDSLCEGGAFVALQNEKLLCAVCSADTYFGRAAAKAETDITVKGAQTAFVEDMDKNVSLLRRIIRTPDLKCERFVKGGVTHTRVALMYVAGRVPPGFAEKLREKLQSADLSVVVDSGNLESKLRKNKYGFFPSFGYTEKVDKAASLLAAGRAVVICDGSPFVLTAPYIFMESLQSAEDYLRSPFYATFMRLLRFASLLTALYLPSLFLIVSDARHELIPTELYEVMEKLRRGIPVPLFWELLIMLLVFEMLREVGLRMPRSVGDAVGIVGSIIIGDAATQAGIASTTVILAVAVSAVANFVVPVYMNTTSLLRLLFLLAANAAGFAGIAAATGAVLCVLCAKRELGVPYLLGIMPFRRDFMFDFVLAVPQKTLGRREDL